MRSSRHSPELMDSFRAYAASLGPTPKPEYHVLHYWKPWIKVPAGHLPIRIVQFSRDDHATGQNRLYHWAIFIPTSTKRGVGNFYEILGSAYSGFFVRRVINGRHPRWDGEERGSHLVGWVAPSYLETLEKHFLEVPVEQGPTAWNSQYWVVDALRGLEYSHMYAVQMDYGQWLQQMELVEEAWDVGDA